MFFKGSARYGGAKQIAEAIEGVGGVLNAATDKELTMYWARVPKTKAKLAIDVLGDMLFQPLLDSAELERSGSSSSMSCVCIRTRRRRTSTACSSRSAGPIVRPAATLGGPWGPVWPWHQAASVA